jgi:hypothetical protein
MPKPLSVAGLSPDVLAGAPDLVLVGALSARDEFGPLDGPPGLLRSTVDVIALQAREDLGHALCAWPSPEDLL